MKMHPASMHALGLGLPAMYDLGLDTSNLCSREELHCSIASSEVTNFSMETPPEAHPNLC